MKTEQIKKLWSLGVLLLLLISAGACKKDDDGDGDGKNGKNDKDGEPETEVKKGSITVKLSSVKLEGNEDLNSTNLKNTALDLTPKTLAIKKDEKLTLEYKVTQEQYEVYKEDKGKYKKGEKKKDSSKIVKVKASTLTPELTAYTTNKTDSKMKNAVIDQEDGKITITLISSGGNSATAKPIGDIVFKDTSSSTIFTDKSIKLLVKSNETTASAIS